MHKLLLLLILSFFSTQGFTASCPDGSEPVRTISADGSYFLYKCGNINNNKKSSNTNEDTIVVQKITPPKDICSETIKKRITSEEYLTESKSFIVLKNRLIAAALDDAFQQVNGKEIRNFQSLALSSENGLENENFIDLTNSKYNGNISSYDVIDRQILDLGSGVTVLSMVIDATVCIKDKNIFTRDVLLIGDFTYKNSKLLALKSEIESVFSQESKSFELGYGNPSTSYHDILVTGKINNVTTEKVVDKKATEEARKSTSKQVDSTTGDAEFLMILSAIANNKNDSDAVFSEVTKTLSNISQQKIQKNNPKISISVVKIFVSVTANHKTDNRTYTATAESKEEISEDLLSNYDLDSLAIGAIRKASKELYVKLNNRSLN